MKPQSMNNLRPGSLILLGMLLLTGVRTMAQTTPAINIGGDIYGGGKAGKVGTGFSANTETATSVTIADGSLNNVYGGGEKGDSKGVTTVTVKGGEINGNVFGGAKMAGIDGGTHVLLDGENATRDMFIKNVYGGNDVSGTVSGQAHVESLAASGDAVIMYVDNLYGGGNGDYDYTASGDAQGLAAPDIASVRIDLKGGCFGQVFGGGNSATVTESTIIELNNTTTTLKDRDGNSLKYQFSRVFGGNNKVAMAIRPTWNLIKGSVDNLYSGGNQGDMTHTNGILLAVTGADMTVNNMFGGCRMADVNPDKVSIAKETIQGIEFPAGFAARVLVTAGRINNVYGGNDVSGNVYGGNALEIRSSIIGDIYGGGNGSYAYTDQATASGDADYYYEIPAGMTSAQALYYHRPNAESVYLHIAGTASGDATYVGGSLYCGGNSATLAKEGGDASVNLKIGSNVVARNVFLGSNGAKMVAEDILSRYADDSFSSLDLTDSDTFEEYMRGCEVAIKPVVSFDEGYTDFSTKFESLYCGGNVGSMSADEAFDLDFLQKLVIYQKLVGGCNNANVAQSVLNAEHEGGLVTANKESGPKVVLNVAGVRFDPKTLTYNKDDNSFTLSDRKDADGLYLGGNIYGGCYTSGYINGDVQINISKDAVAPDAKTYLATKLDDHIDAVFNTALSAFGGGYGKETVIKGNTEINLTDDANIIKVFGGGEMGVVNGSTAINLNGGKADAIYGGGFEGLVKGNATVSLNDGTTHFAFGGACNADIEGYTEMLIGADGDPEITDEVFGGNDFGGQILGAGIHDAYGTDKVKSNTYVLYKNGTVEGGIYGGSYGSYDYTTSPFLDKATKDGFSFPAFTTAVGHDGTAQIYANSYVDIQTSAQDAVAGGNIYGGGYGYLNIMGTDELEEAELGEENVQLPIVDMKDTYVLLRSTNANTDVAPNILGGGYYSTVDNTRVDVRSGLTPNLYGGTYGATAATSATEHMDPAVNYRSQSTTVNVYSGTAKNMNVFGGGANAGSVETNVNLLGGTVNNVYGGSNMEGVVLTANISVPNGSTSVSNAIFGGGYGSDDNLPCDVLTANVNWASGAAYVSGGVIYGGNNAKRATKTTNVNISAPVKTSASGTYANVCGGGNGENTITGYAHVNLNSGALVRNVYGGGRDGKVYGYYDDKSKATAYYDEANYDRNVYAHWAYTAPETDEIWGKINSVPNTCIIINGGATAENIYGAGYGDGATVSGSTYVQLAGGTVTEDIFGGGYSGNVYIQQAGNLGTATAPANMEGNLYTSVDIDAGSVRNVYGGGYNGNVGSDEAEAETKVRIGFEGDPAIGRSIYGGGYKGAVIGIAKTRMWGGHVGYNYDSENDSYVENLNYEGSTGELLKENGNVFGGGFGEGATVDNTDVTLYDGTIRNSLYGGGEIAAIGRGSVNDDKISATIEQAGSTLVHMYGGLVAGDVFGGGRGYAIDAYGNTTTGEIGYSDGYTFGTTSVYLHRGTIGTEMTVAQGQGNVFGGGNIGYVYTASGTKSSADGYYYDTANNLTEDCKVIVAPVCQVTADGGVTIEGTTYAKGDYVPVEKLNTLAAADTRWKSSLDELGIKISNAVFAGGNVSAGSDKVYANAKTVFGNATASVTDVFNKDFITVGDDGIGGLYGDGNLTFVDGYRELNISNYGTDYYTLNNELSYKEYLELTDRERAYFELQYKNDKDVTYNYYKSSRTHMVDTETYKINQKIDVATWEGMSTDEQKNWTKGSVTYTAGSKLSEDEWNLLTEDWKKDWSLLGFCTLYAGRMINTIQRADFCGVFGSRICLRGAQDRVTDVADYTLYTINRVKEVSLNQVTANSASHGNYFGIYNVVNYLGALTSDIDLWEGIRETTNAEAIYQADGETTWAEWKKENMGNRKRNNGSCANEVALASGVWLEIVDESTENQEKDADGNKPKIYGPITGIVQLDLLNVATGEGGGYVYAKNVHGTRTSTNLRQVTLSDANRGAISQKQYSYAEPETANSEFKMQSSGNFVHSTKRIVDDCFPLNGAYYGKDQAPAHYWYVRGEYYIYDQYISAYTGSAQAYAKTVSIPLTITAESQGRLQLESIDDNYYAYWEGDIPDDSPYKSKTTENAVLAGSVTYKKNDPISYWAWSHLTDGEKELFVKSTYVCSEDVTYTGGSYNAGDVILPAEYSTLPSNVYICTEEFIEGGKSYTKGQELTESEYSSLEVNKENCKPVNKFFNITNAVSHDNGFLLTFDWDNPEIWDDYYHTVTGTTTMKKSLYTGQDGYILSPTFRVDDGKGGIYGQLAYESGDLIEEAVYLSEPDAASLPAGVTMPGGQATFEVAYIAKDNCEFSIGGEDYNYVKGAPVAKSVWDGFDSYKDYFEPGYICTETYQMSESEIIINGETLTQTEYGNLKTKYKLSDKALGELQNRLSPVYICSNAGKWGGSIFVSGNNYEAVKFGNLSAAERGNLHYNYDALDMLSENFQAAGGTLTHYQGAEGNNANNGNELEKQIPYAERQSIDYTATYEGSEDLEAGQDIIVTRGGRPETVTTIKKDDVLMNTEYEKLTNEQACYTALVVSGKDAADKIYRVVVDPFQVSDTYYSTGKVISEEVYDNLTDKSKVMNITKGDLPGAPYNDVNVLMSYYFCTKPYSARTAVADIIDNTKTYAVDATVPVGTILTADTYRSLKNLQRGFSIDGKVPTGTSTLYVARETDIRDLSQDKIVTIAYWYEYVESDEDGSNYETIRERHIVNVHVHFESGVPAIGELLPPSTVLPGTKVGLNQPAVSKGAYEILGGGWEMYTNQLDAQGHKNGVPYVNNNTKMYWYQDGYYVAYYAKSYLGKTFSNPVQFSVANYHKMSDVLTSNHTVEIASGDAVEVNDYMYLDEAVKAGKNNPKIYIWEASELDSLAKFFTLTTTEEGLSNVKDAQRLDFYLHDDVEYDDEWTPIGTATDCFEGTFHGDGHTISGLDHSLFGHLCNNVYNLGVTGSFTGGGIADDGDGRAENCWVATTGTPAAGTKAIIGNASSNAVVNCYYPEINAYASGDATAMPVSAFLNGEVAYNLNGFYLTKRYYDGIEQKSGSEYKYWTMKDGSHTEKNSTAKTGYYATGTSTYVEDYYADGQFRYSNGMIPINQNIRENELKQFFPIYPDDYIFFGQKLSFNTTTHDNHPSAVSKVQVEDEDEDDTRLIDLESTGNRVFRAPAYYGNSSMDVAHFNNNAVFNATYTAPAGLYESESKTYNAFKGMTAIDFTGYGDNTWAQGMNNGIFNRKVTDYMGLTDFHTSGLTQNLLAYIPAADESNANAPESKTNSILSEYFNEPTLTIGTTYGEVAKVSNASAVLGHIVQKNGSYVAHEDQFLVDLQDFNAPIAYTFDDGKYMWYQRTPSAFVMNGASGWESVSLPFTADVVTTTDKGVITHFYSGNNLGHEYWLREFDVVDDSKAVFKSLAQGTDDYTVDNTFLWDKYYSYQSRKDKNEDQYQTYYDDARTYENYPLYTAAVPYLIGFPGSAYYEFDMSGTFVPENTYSAVTKLGKQTVTFISVNNAQIGVSDEDYASNKVTASDYTFTASYQTKDADGAYLLNADGTEFALASGDATKPFRAYFTKNASSGAQTRGALYIGYAGDGSQNEEPVPGLSARGIEIRGGNGKILFESTLDYSVTLPLYTTNGKLLRYVTVQPMSKCSVPVKGGSIYLIGNHKVLVK